MPYECSPITQKYDTPSRFPNHHFVVWRANHDHHPGHTPFIRPVFATHEFDQRLGAGITMFVGGWAGGLLFDATGSYTVAWLICIGLSMVAAAVSWPVQEHAAPFSTKAAHAS